MTARDIIISRPMSTEPTPLRSVGADMPLLEVLPRLLDAPDRRLAVNDGERSGVIDERTLLEGIGRLVAARDDSSTIVVECRPDEYSASMLAHAVEDADAHLVDLLSSPTDHDTIRVTLRVRHIDPSAVVHSLERYDFRVVEAYGSANRDVELADSRLEALQLYLNM